MGLRTGSRARPGSGGRRLQEPPGAAAEIDDVEAALLGCIGDPLGEVEGTVDDLGALGGVRTHRGDDRTLGARGDDRPVDPLDPDAGAGAVPALPVGKRLERVDLVGAHVLAEAEEDHPRAHRRSCRDYRRPGYPSDRACRR